MLRWSGQNANQKVGPDNIPTTEKSHRQNANLGWHFSGWHFVRLAFCPTTAMSQNVWIAVLQSHKKLQDGSRKGHEKWIYKTPQMLRNVF